MSFARLMACLIAVLAASLSIAWAQELPGDIRAYSERRAGCNYWPSEPASSSVRRAEIQRHVRQLRCETIDREEAVLKNRYRNQPAFLEAIADAHDAMPD